MCVCGVHVWYAKLGVCAGMCTRMHVCVQVCVHACMCVCVCMCVGVGCVCMVYVCMRVHGLHVCH